MKDNQEDMKYYISGAREGWEGLLKYTGNFHGENFQICK